MIIIKRTADPKTDIIDRRPEYVEYQLKSGERWRIFGECNMCGACYVGAVDAGVEVNAENVGKANAARRLDGKLREDIPVRPEIANLSGCVLTGVYL